MKTWTLKPWHLSLVTCALVAQDATLAPVLKRARLYPNQAWTTRVADLSIASAGLQRIRLTGLPEGLDLDHVRIRAEGPTGLRIGNVVVQQEVRPNEFQPRIQALNRELETLDRTRSDQQKDLRALEHEMELLVNLRPKAAPETTQPQPNPEQTLLACRTLKAQQERLLRQSFALKADMSALSARKANLEDELRQKQAKGETHSTSLLLELESPASGTAHLLVETQTTEARWKPRYEVRLNEATKRMEVLCYASISQKSGEDWKGIQLEISNAEPEKSISLPSMPPPIRLLYEAPIVIESGRLEGRVTDAVGRPLEGASIVAQCQALKLARNTVSDANGVFRLSLLPPGDYVLRFNKTGHPTTSAYARIEPGKLASLGVRMSETAGAVVEVVSSYAAYSKSDDKVSVNYSSEQLMQMPALEATPSQYEDAGELGRAWILDGTRDLPGDALPRQVLLARAQLSPELTLQSVPRVTSSVHLTASAHLPAGFPVFPGQLVAVFKDEQRLGQTVFPRPEGGTGATFSFGPISGLRVHREISQAHVARDRNGQERQWTLREQVLLMNESDQDLEIRVQEPGLASTSDRLRIEPLWPVPPEGTGSLLTWRLKVPAHQQRRLEEGWKIHGPGTGFIPELRALGLPESD